MAAGIREDAGVVGFGLSGGGIRSATFALGFFQGLARHRLLRHIDFLSTVSGGGYFGAFLGRLHSRPNLHTADDVEFVLGGEPQADHPGADRKQFTDHLRTYRRDVLRYLRENGRYLSPNGSGDTLLGGAILLRNLVSIHVALAFFVLLGFLALQLPYILLAAADILRVPPLRIREPVLVSPYVVPAFAALALMVVPTGWAYWLVGHQRGVTLTELRLQVLAPVLLTAFASGAILLFGLWDRSPHGLLAWSLAAVGILTLVVAVAVDTRLPVRLRRTGAGSGPPPPEQTAGLRLNVSRLHLLALAVFVALLGVAVFDTAGATAYWHLFSDEAPPVSGLVTAGAALVGLLAAAQQTVARLAPRAEGRPRLPARALAWIMAIVLLTLYLVLMAILAHGITRGYSLLAPGSRADPVAVGGRALAGVAVLTIVVLLFGQLRSFINRSGHHALYAARLTRAYLGASNPDRHRGADRSVLHIVAGDDATAEDYFPPADRTVSAAWRAAPLHLVNVTVNETIDGRSQVQQRDRKGSGLAFGPCGMSLGVRHHVVHAGGSEDNDPVAADGYQVFPRDGDEYRAFALGTPDAAQPTPWEPLSMGALVGISGAAFTTGLGARTSLPISVLCALANIRLGYWWHSGVDPGQRHRHQPPQANWRRQLERVFPVYSLLLAEMLARFRGTSLPHWYLSDGGHFENLGGYELIRRRPALTVLLDAEADPDYTFHGLAGLIRKARIDFGADIHFLDAGEIATMGLDHAFGSLEQLRRGRNPAGTVTCEGSPAAPPLSQRHFALARVIYTDERGLRKAPERWLVYVKPTMTGHEAPDLMEYLTSNPTFPHQSTGDQFFDENQWESYRMLGTYMAELLCSEGHSHAGPEGWSFVNRMRNSPVADADPVPPPPP